MADARSSAAADFAEINRAIRVLFEPGQVVELRVPNTKKGTLSGYFQDMEKLASAAAQLSGRVPGVYVTLNPIDPSLLARAKDRVQVYAKYTTSDRDVLRRRWLPLDFDPVRPSGISSTDEERRRALDRARRVREWLREMGWPDGVLASSGNGAHLLFRIDLQNDDEATDLVRRVVEAVAALHGGDGVEVDQKVYNAARIWRLYGTLSRKGDPLPERPHRLARILEAPDILVPVPIELLRRVANMLPCPEPASFGSGGLRAGFDVGAWLRERGLEIHSEKEWRGGRLWVLARCPWKPGEHTNLSAFVFQDAAGKIVAKCHHNSCAGKGWWDLRDLLEPGWREKEKRPASGSGRGGGRLAYLPGRIAAPPGWDGKTAVVAASWDLAREAYREGKAAVVAYADGAVPPEAAAVLRAAEEVVVAAENEERRRRLEWGLIPFLAMRAASAPGPREGMNEEAVPREPGGARPTAEPPREPNCASQREIAKAILGEEEYDEEIQEFLEAWEKRFFIFDPELARVARVGV